MDNMCEARLWETVCRVITTAACVSVQFTHFKTEGRLLYFVLCDFAHTGNGIQTFQHNAGTKLTQVGQHVKGEKSGFSFRQQSHRKLNQTIRPPLLNKHVRRAAVYFSDGGKAKHQTWVCLCKRTFLTAKERLDITPDVSCSYITEIRCNSRVSQISDTKCSLSVPLLIILLPVVPLSTSCCRVKESATAAYFYSLKKQKTSSSAYQMLPNSCSVLGNRT